jgi:hypothetical protein
MGLFRSNSFDSALETNHNKGKLKLWLKRLGVAGFLFFLIKGLIWIGIAVFAGKALFD